MSRRTSERVTEFLQPQEKSTYLKLLEWREFLGKLREDEQKGRPNPNLRRIAGNLSDEDVGTVCGLYDRIYDSLMTMRSSEEFVAACDGIKRLIEERAMINKVVVGGEKRGGQEDRFETMARECFPNVELVERDGKKVISTYELGIAPMVRRRFQRWLMGIGRSKEQKKEFGDILDDGFVLGEDGITIFNPTGKGDARSGEFIPWGASGTLSMAVVPPRYLLLPLENWYLREFKKDPRGKAPIGIARVYERTAQMSDTETADKAKVILTDPYAWVDGFNRLRDRMLAFLNQQRGARPKGPIRPITWANFVDMGLWNIGGNTFQLIESLTRLAIKQEHERLQTWALAPKERRRR